MVERRADWITRDSVWLWVVLGVHIYGLVMLAALRASFATYPYRVTPTGCT